jgi:ASTRA-associated protein 1
MEGDAPSPKGILRGHKAAVHVAVFIRDNERLVTGDADGFVILWDLAILRPRAVWQAHTNAILGIAGWGKQKLITYGSSVNPCARPRKTCL